MSKRPVSVAVLAAAAFAAGCAPELDWREVRIEGGDMVALFPCKADRYDRSVEVDSAMVRMRMQSCAAGGRTFAVSHFEVADPARTDAALRAAQSALAANLGAGAPSLRAWPIRGGQAQAGAGRAVVAGRLPDGREVYADAVWFVRGLRVHQASVVGAQARTDVADTFFEALGPAP